MSYQDLPNNPKNKADIWLLTLAYEQTCCGKGGTSEAPKAFYEASMDLEYFEEELSWSPFLHMGLFCDEDVGEIADIKALQSKVKEFLKGHKKQFLLSVGGEHSVSPFITQELLKRPSTIIFFDAHADFRKSYQGSNNSHACALYNMVSQGHKAIAIGLRSFFEDEPKLMKKSGVKVFSDIYLQKKSHQKKLFKAIKKLKGDVYISIDLDAFSPSLIAGTGTPLPGGLEWFMFLKILRKIFNNKAIHIKGADIVELIPEKSKVSQIVAAKIAQKIFSYYGKSKGFHKLPKNGSQSKKEYE